MLSAKECRHEVRDGAFLVPRLLKGMGCRHWLQVSTLLDLLADIPPERVSEAALRRVFSMPG